MKLLSCLLIVFFTTYSSYSRNVVQLDREDPDALASEEEEMIQYRDHTYRDNIKTVQLYRNEDQLSFPVLFLGGTDQLELHFDDLSTDFQIYNYTIVHCNADWTPSDLVVTEYLSDFFDGFIEDYKYSINTLFPYIHYTVGIPNNQVKFKLSGNYLLKVYANNNEEDLLLTKRFYVVEKRVNIDIDIRMATMARYRDYKQEVDFTINHSTYPIQDVYADLKVIISQNRRWDNAITDLKPLFIRSPELVYNYEDKNLFNGDNEYRFFETRNLRYQSLNIDGIQIMSGKTHVFLLPEEPRSFKRYLFWPDINGKRRINRENSPMSDREGDYMITHFSLKRENPVPGGDLYIFGELSDWEYKPEFKMKYVEANSAYELTTTIKQGYYNYNYSFLPQGESVGDISTIEGTHSETNNDYYIFVYHRENGMIYDKLIGFQIETINPQ
ncbi:MAG: glutaredoxin [Vicingaceae bacterium]|jgi:glutaredoxin